MKEIIWLRAVALTSNIRQKGDGEMEETEGAEGMAEETGEDELAPG